MKNLFNKSIVLFLFLIANVVTANVVFDNVHLFSGSSKSLNLQLSSSDGATEIFIKDAKGILLYSEVINASKLSKKFDLRLLPDGVYSVEIAGQTKIKVLPFEVSFGKVNVLDEMKTVVHKPIIRVENNLIYVSKFSPNMESFKISFYDENDNVLVQDKLGKELMAGKIFDISQLPEGNYTIAAEYEDGRSVSKKIKK
ncbi:hypothetical protein [Lutibacter sp.]|uniref:hypothetical protein n=1 Tax=Lutibacter sp. TaxID=1925666 RepID=UPI003568DCE4